MQVYEFHSRYWPIRALTMDYPGRALPATYGPWEAGTETALTVDYDSPLCRVLVRDGFFLTTTGGRPTKREPT
jgi:hypothetical protein